MTSRREFLSAGLALPVVGASSGMSFFKPSDNPRSVDIGKHLPDGLVQLGKAVERPVAQAAQEIALDNQNAGLDLGLVPRLARPGGQNAGIVMLANAA